jgi:DNA-directed RNA polymerase subunit RPC12/RpoP
VNAPPPNYGRPRDPTAFGFTCRNCGHREALYKDGELTCTRCGTKN